MDVFQFLDPYAYLQNYYQIRKNHEADFSYSVWADELGVKSASTLRMMVNRKKKLSKGVAERFVEKSLSLPDEKNYFRLLVSYVHAPTAQDKSAIWAALSQTLFNRIEQKEVSDYVVYLSDLIMPKIMTLLSLNDECWTEAKLAKALDAQTLTVKSALTKLENAEMITSEIDSGTVIWKSKERLLRVSDKLGDMALAAYHNASLDEAKEAQSLPKETRRYRSLLLPLSADEMQSLKQEVENFTKHLINKYQSDSYQSRRLFKVNLNFFPVTQEH